MIPVKDRHARPSAIDDIDAEALVPEAWLHTRQRHRRNVAVVLATVVVAAGAVIAGLVGTGVMFAGRGDPRSAGAVARTLCGDTLGSRALNSAPVSVKVLRASIPGGPGEAPPFRDAFRGAPTAAVAAWCWIGAPRSYRLYAVVQGYRPRYFEGLAGSPFTRTPAPGPAPIP